MNVLIRKTGLTLLYSLLYLTGITASAVQAQDVGLGLFAMPSPRFPCEHALRPFSQSQHPALAILWGTFGKDISCLTKWFGIIGDKPHFLEIHISNEACRRNKRCSSSDFLAELTVSQLNRKLEARDPTVLSNYTALIKEISAALSPLMNGKGEYVLSTGLEDNFSTKAYEILLETVKASWPHKVTRSPVGSPSKSKSLSADYIEGHGPAPSFRGEDKCIANLDGDDIVFPHRKAGTSRTIAWEDLPHYVATYTARCRATFLWAGPWQGLSSDMFTVPLERTLVVSVEDMTALTPFLNFGK